MCGLSKHCDNILCHFPASVFSHAATVLSARSSHDATRADTSRSDLVCHANASCNREVDPLLVDAILPSLCSGSCSSVAKSLSVTWRPGVLTGFSECPVQSSVSQVSRTSTHTAVWCGSWHEQASLSDVPNFLRPTLMERCEEGPPRRMACSKDEIGRGHQTACQRIKQHEIATGVALDLKAPKSGTKNNK